MDDETIKATGDDDDNDDGEGDDVMPRQDRRVFLTECYKHVRKKSI